jgi:peptidylprolyl isomerase
MAQAKTGDTVKVHYTGRLDDGSEFDSSRDDSPLEFTIGKGDVIQGFESAIIGMTPGETKTITIPADEAYGQYNEEMVAVAERDQFPKNTSPEIGQEYEMCNEEGKSLVMTVIEVSDSQITLDANHPLAGEDLTFDLELVEIV